jgi:hypothetical protein
MVLMFFVAKKLWPSLKDDGVIEESIEDIIEKKTKMHVDLTPSSPEVTEKK